MADFDARFVYNMMAKANYTGIATYLRNFKFNDPNLQLQVNQQIKELERYGGIVSAMMNKARPEDREKLSFYFQNMAGSFDESNSYAKGFTNTVNNIGNQGSNRAAYIDYSFDSADSYNRFIDATRLNFQDVNPGDNKTGKYMQNGNYVLRIYKDEFSDGNFFNTLTKGIQKIATEDIIKERNPFDPSGLGYTEKRIKVPHVKSTSYTDDGAVITQRDGLFHNQEKAGDYVKQAAELFNKITNEGLSNAEFVSELMIKPYMTQQEKQIQDGILNGQIDKTLGEYGLKLIKDRNERLLKGANLDNYEVYATEINTDVPTMHAINDTGEKQYYTRLIRTALKAGRVSYTAGSAGGKVGAVITISAAMDKDKLGENAKGDIQLFVPGLLEQDARAVMDSDPDAAVTVKRAEHIAFGHAYNLLQGGRLENFQHDGSATYVDDVSSRILTGDEVNEMMTTQETLVSTADQISNIRATNGLSDEDTKQLAYDYATRLYAYFNNGITPETAQDDTSKTIARKSIEEFMNMILSRVIQYGLE